MRLFIWEPELWFSSGQWCNLDHPRQPNMWPSAAKCFFSNKCNDWHFHTHKRNQKSFFLKLLSLDDTYLSSNHVTFQTTCHHLRGHFEGHTNERKPTAARFSGVSSLGQNTERRHFGLRYYGATKAGRTTCCGLSHLRSWSGEHTHPSLGQLQRLVRGFLDSQEMWPGRLQITSSLGLKLALLKMVPRKQWDSNYRRVSQSAKWTPVFWDLLCCLAERYKRSLTRTQLPPVHLEFNVLTANGVKVMNYCHLIGGVSKV